MRRFYGLIFGVAPFSNRKKVIGKTECRKNAVIVIVLMLRRICDSLNWPFSEPAVHHLAVSQHSFASLRVLCGLLSAWYLSPSLFWIENKESSIMKYFRTLCLLAILASAVGAFAQAGAKPAAPAASPAPQAQASPAPPATFASLVDRQVSQYEKNVVEAAEAMPADKFDFTPA